MDENSNLHLETESIKDRIGVRSSLTDINQIAVFTDEFETRVEEKELREQKDKEALNAQVFVNKLLAVENNGIIDQLFITKTEELIIRNEQQDTADIIFPTVISGMVMLAAFVFGVFCFFGTKGNRRDDVNNKSETSGGR